MGKKHRANKKEEYVLKDGLPSSPFYLRKKIATKRWLLNYPSRLRRISLGLTGVVDFNSSRVNDKPCNG